MTQFLKIAQDQQVTMTIKAIGDEYSRHWVGHQYIECQGEGCGLCQAGMSVSLARNLDVLVGSEAKTWSAPSGAFSALVGLVSSSGELIDRQVTVKRVREQNRTLYRSYLTGLSERYESDDEITYPTSEVSDILKAFAGMLCDNRFAELLEEYLK